MEKFRIYRFIGGALIFFFFMASIGAPSSRVPTEQRPTVPVPGSTPQVCIGYDSIKNKWGPEWQSCPVGYAFFGTDSPTGPCCPLPSKDILTDEHVEADISCPENYVTTGSGFAGCQGKKCIHRLRCTKINTDRYQLAQMTPSLYWGDGFNGWQGAQHIRWDEIPSGIRYAMGRAEKDRWGPDGCVGYPWGSLLTKMASGYCAEMYFRQLQFSGLEGDPARGTPVQMFAECDEVENVFDPVNHRCVKKTG